MGERFAVYWSGWFDPLYLVAGASLRFTLGSDVALTEVLVEGVGDPGLMVEVGTPADEDGYVKAYAPGPGKIESRKGRGDFDGALNVDPAGCPQIAKGETVVVSVVGGSLAEAYVGLTFVEG